MTNTYQDVLKEFHAAMEKDDFAQWVKSAHESGKLKSFLPEVDKLWDIPEREDFHPEGNSGAHTLLVLEQGKNLPAKAKFALLLHDIGKTTTPQDQWPRHIGHDKRGVPLVEQICRRLSVSDEYTDFAKLVCEHHMKGHNFGQMKAAKLYDLNELIPAHDFDLFIQCCRSDAAGRGVINEEQRKNMEEAMSTFNIGAHKFETLRESFVRYKAQGLDKNAALNLVGRENH